MAAGRTGGEAQQQGSRRGQEEAAVGACPVHDRQMRVGRSVVCVCAINQPSRDDGTDQQVGVMRSRPLCSSTCAYMHIHVCI